MEQMPSQDPQKPGSNPREWQLLEKVVLEAFTEQRRARRWSIFFKLLTFAYLILLLLLLGPLRGTDGPAEISTADHVAVIYVNGVIADDEEASADNLIKALRKALKHKHTRAVVFDINSPGGSPVQSGYIYDEIRRLRAEYGSIPIYAVIRDIGASGAYYIASAADDIYADKASLVGSIGVISGSFGFVGAMEKMGIERRLFTAGENKAFLDPFSPMAENQKTFWESVLAVTHRQFIDQVRQGRGERLKETPDTFSGYIWTGEQALASGLIDGLGSTDFVAREVVGVDKVVDFTTYPDPFEKLLKQVGASAGEGAAKALYQSALTPMAVPVQ